MIDFRTYVTVPESVKGDCVKPNGENQTVEVQHLSSLDIDTIERQRECFDMCRTIPRVTGCVGIWGQNDRGCYAHTHEVTIGNGQSNHRCWVFSKVKINGKEDPRKAEIKGKMLGSYLFVSHQRLLKLWLKLK